MNEVDKVRAKKQVLKDSTTRIHSAVTRHMPYEKSRLDAEKQVASVPTDSMETQYSDSVGPLASSMKSTGEVSSTLPIHTSDQSTPIYNTNNTSVSDHSNPEHSIDELPKNPTKMSGSDYDSETQHTGRTESGQEQFKAEKQVKTTNLTSTNSHKSRQTMHMAIYGGNTKDHKQGDNSPELNKEPDQEPTTLKLEEKKFGNLRVESSDYQNDVNVKPLSKEQKQGGEIAPTMDDNGTRGEHLDTGIKHSSPSYNTNTNALDHSNPEHYSIGKSFKLQNKTTHIFCSGYDSETERTGMTVSGQEHINAGKQGKTTNFISTEANEEEIATNDQKITEEVTHMSKGDHVVQIVSNDTDAKQLRILLEPEIIQLLKQNQHLQQRLATESCSEFMSIKGEDKIVLYFDSARQRILDDQEVLDIFKRVFCNLSAHIGHGNCISYKRRLESHVKALYIEDMVLVKAERDTLSIHGAKESVLRLIKTDALKEDSLFDYYYISRSFIQLTDHTIIPNIIISIEEKDIIVAGLTREVNAAVLELRKSTKGMEAQGDFSEEGTKQRCINPRYVALFKRNPDILSMVKNSLPDRLKEIDLNGNGDLTCDVTKADFALIEQAINELLECKDIRNLDITRDEMDNMDSTELFNRIQIEESESSLVIVGERRDVSQPKGISNLKYNHQPNKQNGVPGILEPMQSGLAGSGMVKDDYTPRDQVEKKRLCLHSYDIINNLTEKYDKGECCLNIQPTITGTEEITFAEIGVSEDRPSVMFKILDPSTAEVLYKMINEGSTDGLMIKPINDKFLLILPKHRSIDEVKREILKNIYTGSFKHLMIMADDLSGNQEIFTEIVTVSLETPSACCIEVVIPMTSNLLAIRNYIKNFFKTVRVRYGGKGHFIELVLETKENKANTDGVVTYSNDGLESDNAIRGNLHGCRAIQIRLPKYHDCKSLIEVEKQTRRCMEEATRLKMTSIGFPSLGVGELGYPPAKVAECMMKEIDDYFKHNEWTSLCNVKIVLSDQDKLTRQVFYEENLSRIRKGQIIGDTVHKVIVLISAREQFIKEIQERLLKMIAEPLQLPVKPHKKIKHRNQQLDTNTSLSIPLASEKEEKDTTPSHVAPKKEFFYPVRWKLKQETVRASPLPPGVLLKEINSFSGLRGQIHNQDGMLFEGTLQQKNIAESFLSDYLNNLVPGVNLENVISDYTAMQQSESADSKRKEKNKVNRYDGARREDRINENEGRQTTDVDRIKIREREAMRQNGTINSNSGARPKEYPMNNPYKVPQAPVVDRCIFKGLQKLLGSNKLKDLCHISKNDDHTYCLTEREDKTEEVTLQDLISSLHQEKMNIPEEQIDDVNKFVESYKTHESLNLFVNDDTLNLIIVGQDKNAIRAVMEKVELRLINKNSTNSTVGLPGFTKGKDGTFCTANGKTKIIVKKYDITTLEVDVVVNAANGQMAHGAGVAAAIGRAAGYNLGEECRKYLQIKGEIPVTDICKTTGGNMRCKHVYHAVGPRWYDYGKREKESCLHDLCKTIIRCLLAADIDGLHSIAFPSISSAIFGVPKDSCAEMYTRAVHYADSLYPFTNLKLIYFVDITYTMVDLIKKCFTNYTTTNVKPRGNEEIIMSDFIKKICKKNGVKNIKDGDTGSNMESMENNQLFFVQVTMTEDAASQPKLIFELTSGISIHVYQASVTDAHTESITSMEDTNMSNINTISMYKWLIQKAGKTYETERKKLQKQKSSFKGGEVYTTSGGDLQYRHIFHLITSMTPKEEELLELTDNLIFEITNNPVTSVTIGTSSIKMELKLLFETILKKVSGLASSCLKEIHLVHTSPDMMDKFQTCYEQVIKQAGGVIRHEEPMEANATKDIVTKEAVTKENDADDNCIICLEAVTNKRELACGHCFCRGCIEKALKINNNCPICRKQVGSGVVKGTQPDGNMDVTNNRYTSLSGYEGCGLIEIHYYFPDGVQTEEHPHPGLQYKGTSRTAYLPDNTEGREVLSLLRNAFDRRLIFTIGQSVTTKEDNVVTWNDIHHKTRIVGGATHFGYPDPGYLTRVKEELRARGVVAETTV